jgi:hypothetical protein
MSLESVAKKLNELREERRQARVNRLPEATFGPGKTLEILGSGTPGIIRLSICTNVDLKDVEAAANCVSPTGISSQWKRLEDPTFATGQKNPHPCPDGNDCVHYLLGC